MRVDGRTISPKQYRVGKTIGLSRTLGRPHRTTPVRPVIAFNWSRQTDSNRRPADYKSAALPTELCRHSLWETVSFEALPLGRLYPGSFPWKRESELEATRNANPAAEAKSLCAFSIGGQVDSESRIHKSRRRRVRTLDVFADPQHSLRPYGAITKISSVDGSSACSRRGRAPSPFRTTAGPSGR